MDPIQIILATETLEAIKAVAAESSFDKWLPVGAAIGGAFIGGVIGYLPNRLLENHKRKQESDSVRNALITEIKSIEAIISKREYVKEMAQVIDDLTKLDPETTCKFSVRIPDHYTRVYQAQVSKIGLLSPELATQVITFYQYLDAVVQDITPGGLVAEHGGNLQIFQRLQEILSEAQSISKKIIEDEKVRLAKKCF